MPSPRYTQIDIEATPYYHCISRCVRRAFLCGKDEVSGRNFDHRKDWVVERLAWLSEIYAVSVCAYAVLSNHFHLVVRIDRETASQWDDDEVVRRYTSLFRYTEDPRENLPSAKAGDRIRCWRERLADLSWFMRCLNEAIARRANSEDNCSGRFWEGRFRSQALLDEAGLLTCMSYVDLNPIRAGLAPTLTASDYTSIQQRLVEISTAPEASRNARSTGTATDWKPRLLPLASTDPTTTDDALAFGLEDYTELLTATGIALSSSEPLSEGARQALNRFGIAQHHWLETIRNYQRRFFAMVGSTHAIDIYCARTNRAHAKGRAWAAHTFRPAA